MKNYVFLSNNGLGNLVLGYPVFRRTQYEIDNVSGYKISLSSEPEQEVGWMLLVDNSEEMFFYNRDFVRSLEYLGEL